MIELLLPCDVAQLICDATLSKPGMSQEEARKIIRFKRALRRALREEARRPKAQRS